MRKLTALAASIALLSGGPAAAQKPERGPLPDGPFTVIGAPYDTGGGPMVYVYQASEYYACAESVDDFTQACAPLARPLPPEAQAYADARETWVEVFRENGCYFGASAEGFAAAEAALQARGLDEALARSSIASFIDEGSLAIEGDAATLTVGCQAPESPPREADARAALVAFFQERNCVITPSDALEQEIVAFFEARGLDPTLIQETGVALADEGVVEERGDTIVMVSGCAPAGGASREDEVRAAITDYFEERACVLIENETSEEEIEAYFVERGFTREEVEPVADRMMEDGVIVEQGDRIEMVSGCEPADGVSREDQVRAAITDYFEQNACVLVERPGVEDEIEAYFIGRGFTQDEVEGVAGRMMEAGILVEEGDRLTMVSGCDPSQGVSREAEVRAAITEFFQERACVLIETEAMENELEAFFEPRGFSQGEVEAVANRMMDEGLITEEGDRIAMVSGCDASQGVSREAQIRAAITEFFEERGCVVIDSPTIEAEVEAFFEGRGFTESELETVADQMMSEGLITEEGDRIAMVSGCDASQGVSREAQIRAALTEFFEARGCVFDDGTMDDEFEAFLEARGFTEREVDAVAMQMFREGVLVEEGALISMVSGCERSAEAPSPRDAETRAAIVDFFRQYNCVIIDSDVMGRKAETYFTARGFTENEVERVAEQMVGDGSLVEDGSRYELVAGCR